MNVKPVDDPRIAFFDSIADKWDSWQNLPALDGKLDAVLAEFGIHAKEAVLDIGCGTGNLTVSLLRRLGPSGRVISIDISEKMLNRAQGKADDARVSWRLSPADQLPVADSAIDRAICFSAWPHFQNPAAVAREIHRVLRPGGHLHILHLVSRMKVNRVHAEAHPSVQHDLLIPVNETAELLEANQFRVISMTDNDQCYLVTACKQGSNRDAVP